MNCLGGWSEWVARSGRRFEDIRVTYWLHLRPTIIYSSIYSTHAAAEATWGDPD